MNPFQILESACPDVGSMPPLARHHLREQLFEIANQAQPTPTGPEIQSTNARLANAARIGALALLGAIGVGGLAYSASRDTGQTFDDTAPATTIEPTFDAERTVTVPPPPTIAPTTTAAPVAGTAETPLLLPMERTRLDELIVVRKELGGSSLLLRTPDLKTVALREADGLAATEPAPPPDDQDDDADTTVPTLPSRRFGDVEVSLSDEPGVYDVVVPCGTLEVREGPGMLPFRPQIEELFSSMRLDGGEIALDLPAGWNVISLGTSSDEFVLGIPVEVAGRNVTITLSQFPDGSLAMAGFGDKQFAPATFRGQQAWISRDPDDPATYEIIGMLGTTAFSVETSDLALAELDRVLESLLPGDVDDWVERFGPLPVRPDPDIRTCREQPEFVVAGP